MSDFDPNQNEREGHSHRTQEERRALALLSDLSKALDVQHHDTSLRHTFGGAFDSPVAVSDMASIGSIGMADSPARSDHSHGPETPVWITPTFLNSWTDFGGGTRTARYTKIGGVVHIQGTIKSGTMTLPAFVLDVGYSPSGQMLFSQLDGLNLTGRLDVTSVGAVVPVTGNNALFTINCSFVPG